MHVSRTRVPFRDEMLCKIFIRHMDAQHLYNLAIPKNVTTFLFHRSRLASLGSKLNQLKTDNNATTSNTSSAPPPPDSFDLLELDTPQPSCSSSLYPPLGVNINTNPTTPSSSSSRQHQYEPKTVILPSSGGGGARKKRFDNQPKSPPSHPQHPLQFNC